MAWAFATSFRARGLQYFTVQDEFTEFHLPANHKAFWIPGDYDSNEYAYTTSRVSEVNTTPIQAIQLKAPANRIQTPLMLKSDDGLYVNIHEAALVNYPALYLNVDTKAFDLTSQLVPDATGTGGQGLFAGPGAHALAHHRGERQSARRAGQRS